MKKILLTLINIIIIEASLLAQNSWTQRSCMYNFGRYAAICFTINGKAYAGLGQIPDGTKVYDFWEYDPSANTWTKKADYPGGGSYAATAFAINGKGYVCLGANNSGICQNDLWEYTPGSNIWQRKSGFPGTARYGASCFVIGDTAFVGTGSYGYGNNYLYDMWMYVPGSNSWSQKADFPGNNRSHATAFAIGKYGYLGTGLSNSTTATNDIWRYSKSNDSWTGIPDLPGFPRMGVTSFVINNKAFLGTGFNFNSDLNDFYEYDPATNSWSSPLNIPVDVRERHAAIGFSINNIGYLGTGYSENGLLPDLWAFAPNFYIIENHYNIYFKLYPNPVTKVLNIETSETEGEITLYNLKGQELFKQPIIGHQVQIDIKNLSNGVYFVKLVNGTISDIRKIIKQ